MGLVGFSWAGLYWICSAGLGSTRIGWAQLERVRLVKARLGLAGLSWNGLDLAGLGSVEWVWLGWAGVGSPRLCSWLWAGLDGFENGVVRLCSAKFGWNALGKTPVSWVRLCSTWLGQVGFG